MPDTKENAREEEEITELLQEKGFIHVTNLRMYKPGSGLSHRVSYGTHWWGKYELSHQYMLIITPEGRVWLGDGFYQSSASPFSPHELAVVAPNGRGIDNPLDREYQIPTKQLIARNKNPEWGHSLHDPTPLPDSQCWRH